jgi:hypothetical protein
MLPTAKFYLLIHSLFFHNCRIIEKLFGIKEQEEAATTAVAVTTTTT